MKYLLIIFVLSIQGLSLAVDECGSDAIIVGGKKLQDEFVSSYGNILIQDSEDLTTAEEFKHCGLYSKPLSSNYVNKKVDEMISKAKKSKSFAPISPASKKQLISNLKTQLSEYQKENACIGKIYVSRVPSVVIKRKLDGKDVDEVKDSDFWSINGKGGSSDLHPCSIASSKAAKNKGIALKLCDKNGNYSLKALSKKGYCSSHLLQDDSNKKNCQVKEIYENCSKSFSLGFADNSFEIKGSEKSLLKKKLLEVQECIDHNIKLSNNKWKLKGITISGTSNGFRNNKAIGSYKDQGFIKENINGYIGDDSQKDLYLSYNALSRLRAKRSKQEAMKLWKDAINLKGIKITDQALVKNHYGTCPYNQEGATKPGFQGKSLEKNNMVYIQVSYDPPGDNIDYSKCSVKHKFYCFKPRILCK